MKQAVFKYKDILLNTPEKYYQDYQNIYQSLEDSPAYYKGNVIPFLYQPLFFNEGEIEEFKELTAKLNGILDKIIDRYLSNSQFRSYFGFSKRLEELILIDPGYNSNLPMARFDIFYYGAGKFKFCELNADGSSGMVKTNTLEDYFLEAKAIEELREEYRINYCELVESWIDTLLYNYKEFNSKKNRPNIAIVDFDDYGMISEFKYFKELIEKRDYQVQIVDPRELEYRNNALYVNDFKVDLIYRRAVTMDLIKHYDEIDGFLQAYRNQDVCVVGPIRSQIIHNKVIFSILHDQEKVSFLTEAEQQFIKNYIPYTAIFNPEDENLVHHVINQQNDLVLKPMDLYGSEGVIIGRDVTEELWKRKLNQIKEGTYLVQEFCQVPQIEMANWNKGDLSFESFKYTLGLFLYNQEFKGIYARAGKNNVIASATGCVTLPNFIVEEKG